MNDIFLLKESKIQEFGQRHKRLNIKSREEENEKYKKRLKNQKSFIDSKAMDKEYKEEHIKTFMRLKKCGIMKKLFCHPLKTLMIIRL